MSDVAVIMTFFNPCGYMNQYMNIQTCIANLVKQQVPEIIVLMLEYVGHAATLTEQEFQTPPLPDHVKVVKIQTNSICFHQFALYNIGLQHTTKPKIVLLDADILFDNADWLEKVSKALNKYSIIQPYLFTNYLKADNSIDFTRLSFAASRALTTDLEQYKDIGSHIGHSWAFVRSILPNDKLFPYTIMGSGDDVFLTCAMNKPILTPRLTYLNPKGLEYLKAFNKNRKNARVGYTKTTINHLYHGDMANRQYNNRHEKLAQQKFTLDEMELSDEGLPVFKNPEKWNPHFYHFFKNRKEDS